MLANGDLCERLAKESIIMIAAIRRKHSLVKKKVSNSLNRQSTSHDWVTQ